MVIAAMKLKDAFRGKFMTNPDSILKSRDITLSTKLHLVKAIVFPVVMYAGQEATARTGHGTTDWFKIGKGVC